MIMVKDCERKNSEVKNNTKVRIQISFLTTESNFLLAAGPWIYCLTSPLSSFFKKQLGMIDSKDSCVSLLDIVDNVRIWGSQCEGKSDWKGMGKESRV